jgi:FkbM family methyltransferase
LDSVIEAYRTHFGETAEIVFDIGTRDGDDAEFFREKLNASRVVAIDANPIAVEKTRAVYPEFEVIETAVSDFDGTVKFLQIISDDKDFAGTSSIDTNKANDEIFKGMTQTIEVPVIRMDNLLTDLGLGTSVVDVVKIDVESYTYETLIGFGSNLRKVKVFHLETERKYGRAGHRNNVQVAALMRSSGFYLYDLSYEWGPNIQDQVWVNSGLATKKPRGRGLSEV